MLFTCQGCGIGHPRSVGTRFYPSQKSREPSVNGIPIVSYGREHLLAVRDRLASETGRRWTEAVRSRIPAQLTHLIRRRRGRRAGTHTRRPIQVVWTAHRAPRDPGADTDSARDLRTLAVPNRLTLNQTRLRYDRTTAIGSDPPRPDQSDGGATYSRRGEPEPLNTSVRAANNISLELLNIQSLLPKMPDVRAELQHRDTDILCFTETNLRSGTPNRLVSIPGYNIFRQDRTIGRKKSGGGVAVFARETLQVTQLDSTLPTCPRSHAETMWLNIKLCKKRATVVGVIYRPPTTSASQTNSDFDYIEDQLQSIIAANPSKQVILTGDLNADISTNPAAHQRLLELEKYGLRNLVTVPTFFRGNTESVLDVVLVSSRMCEGPNPPACDVEPCDYTAHHHRVTVTTAMPRVRAKHSYRTGRNWRAMDSKAFVTDVSHVNWRAEINRDASCEQQWDSFSDEMNRLLDIHAPTRRYRVHNPTPPPVSDETLELMSQRRDARRRRDSTYHQLNGQVKRAIRRDTRENIAERVASTPTSSLYRQLRPVLAPKRGPPTQPENLTPDQLNDYFTTVGPQTRDEVADRFRNSGREALGVRLPRVNTGAFNIIPVTLKQLHAALFSMPSKQSQIDRDIPLSIFKLCFKHIGNTLLQIINTSFVTELILSSWKQAEVIPIYKRHDPSKASNFRPVTIVPDICKVVEKLVHEQLTSYLTHHHLFSTDQHGFMKDHSTCTALITITDNILGAMDRSEVTLLTLLDLSRCFDVIDHNMLLTKLQRLQISTGWFKSYLEGHTQRVRVGQTLSNSQHITVGTFQGSSLGPLLFNLACNDFSCFIPSHINGFPVTLVRYADDTQLAISGPRDRLSEMRQSLETVLDVACTWLMQNGMKVNAEKTEVILCGDIRQLRCIDPPSIMFMGQTLQCSDTIRNLGVVMDQSLSFKHHIDRVVQKCTGILLGILGAKHALPPSVLPIIIDALVFSHVRYCIQVYGCANHSTILKLQKVFHFAARVLSGRRKYDHISDVMKQLGWLTAHQAVTFFDVCLMHSILSAGKPEVLRSALAFNHERKERDTRWSNHLSLPRVRTNHGKRRYLYRTCQQYNDHVIAKHLTEASKRVLKKSLHESVRRS